MTAELLQKAIEQSNIIPARQKGVLRLICSYAYAIPAKQIEEELNLTKASANFALQELRKRQFISRKKDGIYLYEANRKRMDELLGRYRKKQKPY